MHIIWHREGKCHATKKEGGIMSLNNNVFLCFTTNEREKKKRKKYAKDKWNSEGSL
jgi:hypothetical protein